MNMPDKPDVGIREIMVVDDPDTVKLLFSGRYGDILDLIDSHEMSVSDIAKILKVNPGSAHYHLKELEKRGLVLIVREETKGNIVKKYYRTAARTISIDSSKYRMMRPGESDPSEEFQDKIAGLMPSFGYNVTPDKKGAFVDVVMRYYRRRKALERGIQDTGIEKAESDRLIVGDAYRTALMLAETEDDELRSIREELRVLLSLIRDKK